jgi:biopolymer transport protein ExbD
MGGGGGGGDEEAITAINVTPLVDIVLVLLIILMVTANYLAAKTIPVDLPQSSAGAASDTPPLAITIDQTGNLFLDARPVNETELRRGIRTAHERDRDLRAVIAGDGRIQYMRVVRVITVLREEGVTKFAINVRPEDMQN